MSIFNEGIAIPCNMHTRILTVLLFCLSLPLNVLADTVYVNDQLRVGVRTEPSNSVAPIGVVTTGMQLDVLERRAGFIRIRTVQGMEGWISESYVTDDKPAALIVEELQEQNRKLGEMTTQKDKLIKTAESATAKLGKENTELQDRNEQLRLQLLEARQAATEPEVSPYTWSVILALLMGVAGFGVGVLWHRRQAMRRLGGLRV